MKSKPNVDNRCSFCARGRDEGISMLIHSKITLNNPDGEVLNDASICKDCAQNTFYSFTRLGQLSEMAATYSAQRVAKFGKTDDEGRCTCETCTFQYMVDTDQILKDIERQSGAYRAEEIPSGTTLQ